MWCPKLCIWARSTFSTKIRTRICKQPFPVISNEFINTHNYSYDRTCCRSGNRWTGQTVLYVYKKQTWVNVVRCLRLAGVGQDAVVGVCPACWGNEEIPLPGDDTPPETVDNPEFGSGFSFLNAPSAKIAIKRKEEKKNWKILISRFPI